MKPRFVSIAVLMMVVMGCRAQQESSEQRTFTVAKPMPSSAYFEKEYVGEIQAQKHIEVRARAKGFLGAVAVDEGQSVKAGQLLFSISAREAHQQLRQAQAATAVALAELKAAELEIESAKMLLEKKVISTAEMSVMNAKLLSLSAKYEEAKAAEGQAAIEVSYAQIRAPFDGVVNRIPKKVGSGIAEDDLLTTLTNTDEVFVYFRVSEQEFLAYSAANSAERVKEVSLKLANGQAYAATGVIDAIENEFDKGTGNIAFRARFANPDKLLRHGATGKVILKTDIRNALVVPQLATFEVQDHLYVYTVDADSVAHATKIVPRLRLNDTFVIESGLSANDTYVVEGIQKVKDGVKIATQQSTRRTESAL
jgi:membrane fusion protein (multidrug efflux system)